MWVASVIIPSANAQCFHMYNVSSLYGPLKPNGLMFVFLEQRGHYHVFEEQVVGISFFKYITGCQCHSFFVFVWRIMGYGH